MLVGLFFSAIVPTGLIVTAVALFMIYWVDKYSLLRLWRRPPVRSRVSDSSPPASLELFIYLFLIICYLLFVIFFIVVTKDLFLRRGRREGCFPSMRRALLILAACRGGLEPVGLGTGVRCCGRSCPHSLIGAPVPCPSRLTIQACRRTRASTSCSACGCTW